MNTTGYTDTAVPHTVDTHIHPYAAQVRTGNTPWTEGTWETVGTASTAYNAAWTSGLRDAMLDHGVHSPELLAHRRDLADGAVLSLIDGTQFRVIDRRPHARILRHMDTARELISVLHNRGSGHVVGTRFRMSFHDDPSRKSAIQVTAPDDYEDRKLAVRTVAYALGIDPDTAVEYSTFYGAHNDEWMVYTDAPDDDTPDVVKGDG